MKLTSEAKLIIAVVGLVMVFLWLLVGTMIGQKGAYEQCHEDCVNNCTSLDAGYYKEVYHSVGGIGTDCWCIRDKTPFSIGRMESSGPMIC